MIGGIVITHGEFAAGLKQAVEMITGKQEQFYAIGLHEGEGLMELAEQIQQQCAAMKCDQIILFTDLFGASPCNASGIPCAQFDYPIITGVNMPVLLDFVLKRETTALDALLETLTASYQAGYKILRQVDYLD